MTTKKTKVRLGEISEIRSGLVLSRKRAGKGKGGVSYRELTFRAVNADGTVDTEKLDTFVAADKLSADYLSRIGDVIVRLTTPYTAVLIDRETADMVISSNFLIIRKMEKDILPEYLFWLLNTERVKADICRNATNNVLGTVRSEYFQRLIVETVPMERQMKIAGMNRLARREVFLLNRLAQEKKSYYAAVIDRLQRGVVEDDGSK